MVNELIKAEGISVKSIFLSLLIFFVIESEASRRQTVYPSMGRWGAELVTPDDLNMKKKRPLLVLLHGCKIDAKVILDISEVEKYVDQNDFAVLAPNQSRALNPDNCWNFFSDVNQRPYEASWLNRSSESYSDLAYISRAIESAIENASVDPRRIYVAGISAGAAMALNTLLCDRDHQFAGVAMSAGLPFGVIRDPFKADDILKSGSGLTESQLKNRLKLCPRRIDKVKFIVIHGDQDTRINKVNLEEVRKQIHAGGANSSSRVVTRLIPGLAHKWSGSQFDSIYAEPKTAPFTPMFLRHFGIIK